VRFVERLDVQSGQRWNVGFMCIADVKGHSDYLTAKDAKINTCQVSSAGSGNCLPVEYNETLTATGRDKTYLRDSAAIT
jgi:hypothetical protein